MYKLWRDLNTKTNSHILKKDKQFSESILIQQISRLIKILKKKQDIYWLMLISYQKNVVMRRQKKQIQPSTDQQIIIQEYHTLMQQQNICVENITMFRNQPFFQIKTYLYTVYMRLIEIIQLSRQKLKNVHYHEFISNRLEEGKKQLMQCYHYLHQNQKYDFVLIISTMIKNQNYRIKQLIPRRGICTPLNKGVSNLNKNILNCKNDNIILQMRKTTSLELIKKNKSNKVNDIWTNSAALEVIVNKKLMTNNKEMATAKRITQRRKDKIKLWNKLYKIIQVKPIKIEDTSNFRIQLEEDMLNRNAAINLERKNWQKNYQTRKNNKNKLNFRSTINQQSISPLKQKQQINIKCII